MCQDAACGLQNSHRVLTFESMLTDPLTRLVMDSDGVTSADLLAVMEVVRKAVVAREREAMALPE